MSGSKKVKWDNLVSWQEEEDGRKITRSDTPYRLLIQYLDQDLVHLLQNKPAAHCQFQDKQEALDHLSNVLKRFNVQCMTPSAVERKFKSIKSKYQEACAWRSQTGNGLMSDLADAETEEDRERIQRDIGGMSLAIVAYDRIEAWWHCVICRAW